MRERTKFPIVWEIQRIGGSALPLSRSQSQIGVLWPGKTFYFKEIDFFFTDIETCLTSIGAQDHFFRIFFDRFRCPSAEGRSCARAARHHDRLSRSCAGRPFQQQLCSTWTDFGGKGLILDGNRLRWSKVVVGM